MPNLKCASNQLFDQKIKRNISLVIPKLFLVCFLNVVSPPFLYPSNLFDMKRGKKKD
jgi:hypothetical protein